MAPVLPLVLATSGDETAHHLQIEPPAVSRGKRVKLDDDGNVIHGEAFIGIELRLE